MGQLTTHVLDTARGGPAAGVPVSLYDLDHGRTLVVSTVTNTDGRTDEALLDADSFQTGTYELEFKIGDYFASRDQTLTNPPFLDCVVIRVTLGVDEHYHVPLLASPWSYSTYRGS